MTSPTTAEPDEALPTSPADPSGALDPRPSAAGDAPDPSLPRSTEVEDRLAALERRLLRVTERLDELPQRIAERLDAAATLVTTRVAAAGRQAENGVASTLERSEELLGEHNREMNARLERLEDRTSAAIRGTEEAATAVVERSEESLRALSRDVGAVLEGLDERSAAAVSLAERASTEMVERSEAVLQALSSEAAAVLERLDERAGTAVRGTEAAATTLTERSTAALDAVSREVESLLGRVAQETQAAVGEPLRRWETTLGDVSRSSSELASTVASLSTLLERAGRESDRGVGHLQEVASRAARTIRALDASLEQLSSEAARVQEETARSRKELTTSRRHLETRVTAAIDSALERFVAEATEATLSATHASDQVVRSVSALGDVEGALREHRRQLDGTLQRERAALLDDLLGRLVDGLPRRERRRLAEELLEHRGREAGTDGGATPSTTVMPELAAVGPGPQVQPFADLDQGGLEARPASEDLLEVDHLDDAEATTSGQVPPPSRAEATAAREELYAAVLSVSGIGPGRATALVDVYRGLDELAASSADEIVELVGFPAQLAEETLSHVRELTS